MRRLILQSHVETICTTDDLRWHRALREDPSFPVKVLPAWRPDKAVNLEKPEFRAYLGTLSETAGKCWRCLSRASAIGTQSAISTLDKEKGKTVKEIQNVIQKKSLPVRVVQFEEERLLRSLIEPAFQAAVEQGRFAGSLAIFKPTGRGNLDAFERQSCLYTVVLRGKRDGAAYDEVFPISCVDRAVNPYRDFESFLVLARLPELEFVISNTTEAGIVLDQEDRFDAAPPAFFPGKLTRFLYEWYWYGKGTKESGLAMLPTELIERNGDRLRESGQMLDLVKRYSQCSPEKYVEGVLRESGMFGELEALPEFARLAAANLNAIREKGASVALNDLAKGGEPQRGEMGFPFPCGKQSRPVTRLPFAAWKAGSPSSNTAANWTGNKTDWFGAVGSFAQCRFGAGRAGALPLRAATAHIFRRLPAQGQENRCAQLSSGFCRW